MKVAVREDDYVVIDRCGIIENRHVVHAAVVDSAGKLLYYLGNPDRMTLIRSAAKPAQALAVVETGALEQFSFDEADLALMCASHSSEERHISRARLMLAKAGNEENDLRCGGHPAVCPVVNKSWVVNGFAPSPVCSNCSGKHAGMLAGARAIGSGAAGYHLSDHPIQGLVKKSVQELSGLDEDSVKWGLDGCNMPAPAFPLHFLARLNAAFAQAADDVANGTVEETRTASPARARHMARIFNAMVQYPEMVAGEGRFCTILMQAFGGSLIGKIGADACYGIGIRESESTRSLGSGGAIGIAVKIEDGNIDILYAAVAEILAQLQIGTPEDRHKLTAFHDLKIKNTMGVVTGTSSFQFKMKRA